MIGIGVGIPFMRPLGATELLGHDVFTDDIITMHLRVADDQLQIYDLDNDEVLVSFNNL